MDDEEKKGVYAGSGGFRVDRSRMLDQLARYGFLRAHDVVLAVARFAVLGKASQLKIKGLVRDGFSLKSYDGLELEFDGAPLDEAALRNPYDCLFSDAPDRRRMAQLARALLTLSRTEARELTLTSGPEGARFQLSVRSAADDDVRRVGGAGPTVLRVAWESFGAPQPELLSGLAGLIEERMRHAPIPVELSGVWLGGGDGRVRHSVRLDPAEPLSAVNASFERGGLRGRVELPMRVVPATGHIALYWGGVEIERLKDAPFLPVPADGFVDSDAFSLDLSASAIVRDDAYLAAVAEVSRAAASMALGAARAQAALMTEAAGLLAGPQAREVWTDTHEGRVSNEPESSWWDPRWSSDADMEARRKVYRAAARARWLRYCARSIAGRASAPELKEALFAAPLYFSTTLEPLSLDRLKERTRLPGGIPASARLGAAAPEGGPVLWLSSNRDAALLPDGFPIKRLH